MRLSDTISKVGRVEHVPNWDMSDIEGAVKRVHDRWPDDLDQEDARDPEEIAMEFLDYVQNRPDDEVRLSFVIAGASAIFDGERCERKDLGPAHTFLYVQVRRHKSKRFLSGMLRVYLESFRTGAEHSMMLAVALNHAKERMDAIGQKLLLELEEVLDHVDGPALVAERMEDLREDLFNGLFRLGMRRPHSEGFMHAAHDAYCGRVRDSLKSYEEIKQFLAWLFPEKSSQPWKLGAGRGIEAILHPWLNENPPDELRSLLVENLMSIYGDPRLHRNYWSDVDGEYMKVMFRWITGEDLRFFIDVVSESVKNKSRNRGMWEKRRGLWLDLYDDGRIKNAWVAFSTTATFIARNIVNPSDTTLRSERFGWQRARQDTSILIMEIGDKIFVEGCHDYGTRVFNKEDPMAPEFFKEGYDCDEIMRRAPDFKRHISIPVWSRWVRDMVNADLPDSLSQFPYSTVLRPNFL